MFNNSIPGQIKMQRMVLSVPENMFKKSFVGVRVGGSVCLVHAGTGEIGREFDVN